MLRTGEGIVPADIVYHPVLGGHSAVVLVAFDWRFHPQSRGCALDGRRMTYERPVEHTVAVVGCGGDSFLVFSPWSGPQTVGEAACESSYARYDHMPAVVE